MYEFRILARGFTIQYNTIQYNTIQYNTIQVVLQDWGTVIYICGFPKIRGPLFGSPYNEPYTILGSISGPLIFGIPHIAQEPNYLRHEEPARPGCCKSVACNRLASGDCCGSAVSVCQFANYGAVAALSGKKTWLSHGFCLR